MDNKILVGVVAALLITVTIAGYLIMNNDDGEENRNPDWSFTQSVGTFSTVEYRSLPEGGNLYVYPGWHSSTTIVGANPIGVGGIYPDQGSYLFWKCDITFSLPEGYDSSKMNVFYFQVKCFPTDDVSWGGVSPQTGGPSNQTMTITDGMTISMYFVVPGTDASYDIQEGEFVLSFSGSMEIET